MQALRGDVDQPLHQTELKDSGHSIKKIAKVLKISKNTVKGILKNRDTFSANGETLSETRFWREINRRLPPDLAKQIRIRMKHEPGDRIEIDYTDGLFITDRKTGHTIKTQLFVAVSSSSDYTFAEFTMKQKQCEFIASQNRMFQFFGGVAKYLVCDNLKSGVFKAHRYDPDLNTTYCEYANHMGFAVFPARPTLEDEQMNRKQRLAKALQTKAKFRPEAELEDWDHAVDRGLSKPQFKDLVSLSFYQNKENLILIGPTGTGKTHLAIALGKKLCRDNVGVKFCSVNLFLEECQAEKTAGRYLSFIKRMKKIEVLVLDDFGLRNYSHDEANILVDLLEERYQKGSAIITS